MTVHSRSLIRILTGKFWRTKDAKLLLQTTKHSSDCTDAQADLSICSEHMSEGMFSHGVAHVLWILI